jgi:hypothetical protein
LTRLRPCGTVCSQPTWDSTLEAILTALGTAMIAATLPPLAKPDDGGIRIFDFPRLQIAAISGLVLVLLLVLLLRDDGSVLQDLWLCVLRARALYQAYRMYPYTPLHRKRVQDSVHTNPASTLSVLYANVLMSDRNAQSRCG